jgi:DNA adenine methylase
MEPILEFGREDETTESLMAQPFGSPGGKKNMAAKIIKKIPDHKVYVEPYAGGAAVFFKMEKRQGVKEVLNDLNANIAHMYLFMKQASPEQLVKAGEMCRILGKREFYEMKARLEKTPIEATPQGFADFYNMNRSSFANDRDSYGYMNKGLKLGIGARLEALHERMKNVEICNDDAIKVIKEYDSPDTFYYLDPPYPKTWRSSHGYSYENVEELAATLAQIKGKYFLNLGKDAKVYQILKKNGLKIRRMKTKRTANCKEGHGVYEENEHISWNYNLEQDELFQFEELADAGGKKFSEEEVKTIGTRAGIDWSTAKFPLNEFRMGLEVELEHGTVGKETNVTNDDNVMTAKIAWAHLNEIPNYYTLLAEMEAKGKKATVTEKETLKSTEKMGEEKRKTHYTSPKELLQNLVSGAPYAVMEGRRGEIATLSRRGDRITLTQGGKDIGRNYEGIVDQAGKISKKDYTLTGKILPNKTFLTLDILAYDGQSTEKHEFYERRKVGEQLQYNEGIRKAKCLVLTAKDGERILNELSGHGSAIVLRADSTYSNGTDGVVATYTREILSEKVRTRIDEIMRNSDTKISREQLETIALMTLDSDHIYWRSNIAKEAGVIRGTVYNQQKALGLL